MGGRYALGDALAEGDNGVVYRSLDTRGGQRVVATKVLHGNGAPDPVLRRNLADERDVLAQLDHPNVVQMLDAGSNGSTDWIVLDYATAGDLAEVLRLEGPFDEPAVLQIALQLLAALESAHRRGILHHAVRAENLLIGHRGRILLSGFTHARRYGAPSADVVLEGRGHDLRDAAHTLFHLFTGCLPGDLSTYAPADPRWDCVPDWIRPVLQGAGDATDPDAPQTAEAFALELIERARRYRRPDADSLAAAWSEVAPEEQVPEILLAPIDLPEDRDAGFPAVLLSIGAGLVVGGALIAVAALFVL